MASVFPLPGVKHGERIIATIVEGLARSEPDSAWVSIPVDDLDLAKGFQDVSYAQFERGANRAAHWLRENLPPSSEDFQKFAYSGPNDLRYLLLALAAAKIGKVMVVPSFRVTVEAQLHILAETNCTVYIRAGSMADMTDKLKERTPSLEILHLPDLAVFHNDYIPVDPIVYPKTWAEGKADPWLVFHTSGTTGLPRPTVWTQEVMSYHDQQAAIKDLDYCIIHQAAVSRCYITLPLLHITGMSKALSDTASLRTVAILGPAHLPPTPDVVKSVLQNANIDGAMLAPSQIEAVCQDPAGLEAMRRLKYINYAGAPLNPVTGNKLSSYVHVVPVIGSTEAGGYPTKVRSAKDSESDWDYFGLQTELGAAMEPRDNGLHELVLFRTQTGPQNMLFLADPKKDRHETKDLFVEHPTKKGLFKLVGRSDDYVYFTHGGGLHASTLEPEIERCEIVQTAFIGGHGKPAPVLLVELYPSAEPRLSDDEAGVTDELQPFIDAVNERCHQTVHLSTKALVFVRPHRPLPRTAKGTASRGQSLELYREEIDAVLRDR